VFNIKYKHSRPQVIDSATTFLQLFYIWKWGMIAAGSVLVDTQTRGRHGALGTRGVLPNGTRVRACGSGIAGALYVLHVWRHAPGSGSDGEGPQR
jgi:hypothetical protein